MIEFSSLSYRYPDAEMNALQAIDLSIDSNETMLLAGMSGSGKSTLLHCMAGLDSVTEGEVRVGDTMISELSDQDLTLLRRQRMGFIFQAFNLVPTLTAEENILLPLLLGGSKPDPDWESKVIESLGLGDRLHHRPDELSGGQQQRVAVARALVSQPEIIFADEPTGNLDSKTGQEVLALMEELHTQGRTILMITHDPAVADRADRQIQLHDGQVLVTA